VRRGNWGVLIVLMLMVGVPLFGISTLLLIGAGISESALVIPITGIVIGLGLVISAAFVAMWRDRIDASQ
jgi:hypothetical protein